MHKDPRQIRDVFADMPELQRFSARLSDPAPFSEAEHFVLSQGHAERQATLPLGLAH